jgi:hypothetical protein
MRIGTKNPSLVIGTMWQKIFDTRLTSAATSFNITGLNGDTDEEYMLMSFFVSNAATNTFEMRFNTDTGTNYGYQKIGSDNGTNLIATSGSLSYIEIGYTASSGQVSMSRVLIYAISGKTRPVRVWQSESVTTSVITGCNTFASSWSNTANEITTINILSSDSNGLGVGTQVCLYRKVS